MNRGVWQLSVRPRVTQRRMIHGQAMPRPGASFRVRNRHKVADAAVQGSSHVAFQAVMSKAGFWTWRCQVPEISETVDRRLAQEKCSLDRLGGFMIRKLVTGEYRLYSRKKNPKTGKRRNLGTFKTRKAAEKHEQDVQYFKRH
jgi:hypothetical protein